jgi:erythromycin esterase-like protein
VPDPNAIVSALREFVDALDRRQAHFERLGEARIAREVMALCKEALTRMQELTSASCERDAREAERSASVMADDGGPVENNQDPIQLANGRA